MIVIDTNVISELWKVEPNSNVLAWIDAQAAKHTTKEVPMDEGMSLRHSRWECKYHIVFIPKCRRKVLYEQLRHDLGEVFRTLAWHKMGVAPAAGSL